VLLGIIAKLYSLAPECGACPTLQGAGHHQPTGYMRLVLHSCVCPNDMATYLHDIFLRWLTLEILCQVPLVSCEKVHGV